MLAHKNQYEISPNQELWGLGVANLAGACFGAYPSTGKTTVQHPTTIVEVPSTAPVWYA